MAREGRGGELSRRRPREPRSSPAHAPVPLRHPAWLVAGLLAAASIVLSASYRLHDTDLWQLLVVGKAIWSRHALPSTDEWTWAGFGDPQVTSSWGFRALIWPLWSAWGVGGLFAYRWAAMLAAFGLLWATARSMGARGFGALFVLAWAALAYRQRAEIRPESLVAVLMAAELWVLEAWRAGSQDRRGWLVAVALVWANVHISYWLGLGIAAIYAIDAVLRPRSKGESAGGRFASQRLPSGVPDIEPLSVALSAAKRPPADPPASSRRAVVTRFALIAAAMIAVSFANPFGMRALLQPFEFATRWRNEPFFRNVVELWPLDWSAHSTDGLPVLLVAWPLLALLHGLRRGWDVAEVLACAAFTSLAISSQRFIGFYALVAAPFVSRDAASALPAPRGPRWLVAPWTRALVSGGACIAIGVAEWGRPDLPLGIGLDRALVPAGAADFMAAHGIRGRMFNHFHLGGYLAYRGWPDRDRLPFVTTQPENIRPEIREAYPRVFVDAEAWRALDRRYRFDIAILDRDQDPGDRLLDFLDADSSWALVFADDVAELLVRRDGALDTVARDFAYRAFPAGIRRRTQAVPAAAADTAYRSALRHDLARMAGSSPENGHALHLLGILDMMDGDLDHARARLEAALAKRPFLPGVHELLGVVALQQSRPRDALREFERERSLHGEPAGIDARIGQAHEALGDVGAARRSYTLELRRHPEDQEAKAGQLRLTPK